MGFLQSWRGAGATLDAVGRLLSAAASLGAERRLGSCGAPACLLRGTWDLPRPGIEPVSPELARQILIH